jgi:hypothetical protein
MRRLDAIVADLLAGLQAMIAKRQRRRLQRLNLRRRSGAARQKLVKGRAHRHDASSSGR